VTAEDPRFTWRESATPTRTARLPCDSCVGRSLNLCQPLDDPRLAYLLSLGGRRKWQRRDSLFRAVDPIKSFFKITKGIVTVSRTLSDGRRQILAVRVPGDVVGYLERDGRYEFDGEAMTDVEACAFDKRQFEAFAAREPDLAAAVGRELSAKLAEVGNDMAMLGQLDATERVAYFLHRLSSMLAERGAAASPFPLNLTRNDIADCLGLTLETVSRTFTKLKDRHIIALVGSDQVAILDRTKLSELAKSDR
jgi:CRP/FNR family transcriptional regulator